MSLHSLLSASASERWMACPISVTGDMPDTTTRAAAEGTMGHGIGEDVLRGLPWPAIGEQRTVEGHDFTIEQSFLEDVYAYVQFIHSFQWRNGFQVEGKVNYSRALAVPYNFAFGTSDCWGFSVDSLGPVLEVIDLKMGRKSVNPQGNLQAVSYVGGVLDSLYPALVLPRDHRVRVSIFQPRLSKKPFQWMTTVGDVEDALRNMRPAAAAAVAYHTKTATQETWNQFPEMLGDHCRYCRRKNVCNLFQRQLREAGTKTEVVWNVELYKLGDAIKVYLEQMEQTALNAALAGTPLPGTKLVAGRPGNPQLLVDNAKIREIAATLGIENKVVEMKEVWATPAKVRDAFKAVGMQPVDLLKIVKSPEGSAKLALSSDPRPELRRGADTTAFTATPR